MPRSLRAACTTGLAEKASTPTYSVAPFSARESEASNAARVAQRAAHGDNCRTAALTLRERVAHDTRGGAIRVDESAAVVDDAVKELRVGLGVRLARAELPVVVHHAIQNGACEPDRIAQHARATTQT